MDVNVIQEYLVSLGWKVDNAGLRRFTVALEQASQKVESHTTGVTRMFVKTAATVAGVYASIGAATVGLAEHVAKSDLGFQLYALRMHMSTEAAKKLKIATDALGYSLDEIAWNPELRERYFQLVKDQTRMQSGLGPDFARQMRAIRDIRFEFTRLEVAGQYLMMGVVRNVAKAFGLDEGGLQRKMKDFVDYVEDHLPQISTFIANKVAPVLSSIGTLLKDAATAFIHLVGVMSNDEQLKTGAANLDNMGRAAQHIADGIQHAIDKLDWFIKKLDSLPEWAKKALAWGAGGALVAGPAGAAVAATS